MDWIVLRFFFDFRGGKRVTNTFEGLLRSLLYQLIKEIPQIDVLGLDDNEHGSFTGWPEYKLRDTVRSSLENAKEGVCIFVDGLDEYEGSVLQLIHFLRDLTSNDDGQLTTTKVCISSRPEPIPFQLLQDLPKLSTSDCNRSGIRSYCLHTLKKLEPKAREGLDISHLSQTVAERAEGVFLWARFALEELILGHFSGESLEEILMRLDTIPSDLEEIYDRILSRMEPLAKKECLTMLELVCFAKRTLTWQEHLVACEVAMTKDVAIMSERVFGDPINPADKAKLYSTFAKRLRAKAVGLLEIVEIEEAPHLNTVRLIHRSVSRYLEQKGWQILGESERVDSVGHESFCVETCTRYLHGLLRHCKMERTTSQSVWKDWFKANRFHACFPAKIGIYPFFAYAARFVFEHAYSLERHRASSYPLLYEALTGPIFYLHILETTADYIPCGPCSVAPRALDFLFDEFNAIYVAFLHGLTLYCKSDLAVRLPAPGKVFWEQALRCAIFSGNFRGEGRAEGVVSLALQNVTTVQQVHIEALVRTPFISLHLIGLEVAELVLHHESVKDLRLIDGEGQAVTLFWHFAQLFAADEWMRESYEETILGARYLKLWVETANKRGEDVRQRCGPEGNLIETLLKQEPSYTRRSVLRVVREFYESMSWPFEYDLDEIERFKTRRYMRTPNPKTKIQ